MNVKNINDNCNDIKPIESVSISNVVKTGDNTYDLILVKKVSSRKMTIFYSVDNRKKIVPYEAGRNMLDILPDGGRVTSITNGSDSRYYATINLSLDQINIEDLKWEPRHRAHKKKSESASSEDD